MQQLWLRSSTPLDIKAHFVEQGDRILLLIQTAKLADDFSCARCKHKEGRVDFDLDFDFI